MSETDKPRQSVKRQLKPAPQRPGQDVHCPRFKAEVHFVIPGSMPEIGGLIKGIVLVVDETRNSSHSNNGCFSAFPGSKFDATVMMRFITYLLDMRYSNLADT
ncbi:unnamed protein product [Fusarium fujikuroi]|uniref:Uncharacterized protein n=1 Tax=Fusarium fujikuroi TaxID=5127 RepID=A0A9Q9U978_FUSFU|nr:unnamed protein product [Fusarium fujikuroi]VTT82556.1 unnamed protein product [Fusarium fujikuroi]VZH87310.1 unnamed protein product [Fusarium fujikuroi]